MRSVFTLDYIRFSSCISSLFIQSFTLTLLHHFYTKIYKRTIFQIALFFFLYNSTTPIFLALKKLNVYLFIYLISTKGPLEQNKINVKNIVTIKKSLVRH